MGLLEGKKIVITGVMTDASLAYGVARIALDEGAEIVLTGAGRALSLTQRTARKLGDGIDVFEFDVTVPEHGATRPRRGRRRSGATSTACSTPSVSRRRRASATTFLERAVGRRRRRHADLDVLVEDARRRVPAADGQRRFVRRPRLRQQPGVAGLQLDGRRQVGAAERVALPGQGTRSAWASARTSSPPDRSARWPPSRSPASPCSRTSGTTAPRSAGTSTTPTPVAKACVALLSDWFPATTGEIIHVDGGFHATGV